MESRFNTNAMLMALVAGLSLASGSLAFAQGEPTPPPPRAAGQGGPEGGPRMDGPGRGEAISDKELAERLRGRADEVEHLARTLREAADKAERGDNRMEAFHMVEEAIRPLRGD